MRRIKLLKEEGNFKLYEKRFIIFEYYTEEGGVYNKKTNEYVGKEFVVYGSKYDENGELKEKLNIPEEEYEIREEENG